MQKDQKELGLFNETPEIRTFTGKWVNVFFPTKDMFRIEDVAHALSNAVRFCGHTKHFYSVGQHSIFVRMIMEKEKGIADPDMLRCALMHDMTEAFLCDLPKPIKDRLPEYKKVERDLKVVMASVFCPNLDKHYEIIHECDMMALQYEWEDLMIGDGKFLQIPNAEIERRFYKDYMVLSDLVKRDLPLPYTVTRGKFSDTKN